MFSVALYVGLQTNESKEFVGSDRAILPTLIFDEDIRTSSLYIM